MKFITLTFVIIKYTIINYGISKSTSNSFNTSTIIF